MPTLNEMQRQIGELVKTKGFADVIMPPNPSLAVKLQQALIADGIDVGKYKDMFLALVDMEHDFVDEQNKNAFIMKSIFAFVELGEAIDAWKKGMRLVGPDKEFKTVAELRQHIGEEFVDSMFYILDAARVQIPEVDMDDTFDKKLAKNMGRPHRYGEGEHLEHKR
jgi:NTP pyrophosphatase (non-canonical NTP hydrolase)